MAEWVDRILGAKRSGGYGGFEALWAQLRRCPRPGGRIDSLSVARLPWAFCGRSVVEDNRGTVLLAHPSEGRKPIVLPVQAVSW